MENLSHYLNTNELAESLGVKGATARRSYCVNGHYMGIKPMKLPNNRLLWSKADRDRILKGHVVSSIDSRQE